MVAILDGTRVLDLTTIVAGPYATLLLAELGADVVRVEAPGGDAFRAAPPSRHAGMGAGSLTIGRGKRSVGVDLATDGGQEVLAALAATADVAVHNLRPGSAQRLGVDVASLRRHNPRLVHCTTTGFGSGGPDADRPAYDDIIQGRAGIASLLATADGTPRLAPTILADKVTGLFVAQAVLAALLHRDRTGEALAVEVPMLEATTAFLMLEHMGGHAFDPPIGPPGYNRLLSPDRRPHATADGHIVVLPYTTRHWRAVLDLVDEAGWADAAWVDDPAERAARIDELYALLSRLMATRTTSQWIEVLAAADVPAGPVTDLPGVLADPHLDAVDMFPVHDHATEGRVRAPRHPVSYDGRPPPPPEPAPGPGADTRTVLAELGLAGRTAALLAAGAVWEGPAPAGPAPVSGRGV